MERMKEPMPKTEITDEMVRRAIVSVRPEAVENISRCEVSTMLNAALNPAEPEEIPVSGPMRGRGYEASLAHGHLLNQATLDAIYRAMESQRLKEQGRDTGKGPPMRLNPQSRLNYHARVTDERPSFLGRTAHSHSRSTDPK